MIATSPVFLFLVPAATVISIFDGRDVFPAAHQWTHGIFFGHRWKANPPAWETCGFCGKTRVAQNGC